MKITTILFAGALALSGTAPSFEDVALVDVFAAPGDAFNYIAFLSTLPALEIALVGAVPLPASGVLLLAACAVHDVAAAKPDNSNPIPCPAHLGRAQPIVTI